MNELAQKCVAAARNVAEGSPTLGKLIREGKTDPMSARVNYEFAAVLRTMVEELQYYNFSQGEDMIVDARKIYELADAIETLDKPSTDS